MQPAISPQLRRAALALRAIGLDIPADSLVKEPVCSLGPVLAVLCGARPQTHDAEAWEHALDEVILLRLEMRGHRPASP